MRLLLHEELKGEVDAFSRVLEAIAAGNHLLIFGEARWMEIPTRGRCMPVPTAGRNALMEKGLLWLRGDTARWDVHCAFFARAPSVGEVEEAGLGEENLHLFTPEDITTGNA